MSSFQSKFASLLLAEVESAIMKAATPSESVPEFATAEAARDHFRDLVMSDLTTRFGVVAPKTKAAKAPKAVAPVEALTAAMGALTVEEKPKKGKKTKPAVEVNLAKIDPTWRKHLKAGAKALKKEITKDTERVLLAYLNGLSKEEFNAKKSEEHIATFLEDLPAPPAIAAAMAATVPTTLTKVEFQDQDYFVNLETKRVYEGDGVPDDAGNYVNYTPVGYVGMMKFAEMEI